MPLELLTPLPPGTASHTRLARHGQRLVVLRELLSGTDCSYPPPAPHLVALQEVGEMQGKRHALFPWVPGVTLRDLVDALARSRTPVPLGLVGRVVIEGARALSRAAPRRAHGGLNDGAFQLTFEGEVHVLDFGAPRATRFRPLGRTNFAADVFSLGAVVHAAVTRFEGSYTDPALERPLPSQVHAEATPALDDVLQRALARQPDERQADVAAFADELEVVIGPLVFTAEQLSALVLAHFGDRKRQLESLVGDLANPSLPPQQPLEPIPTSTQPNYQRDVPWVTDERAPEPPLRVDSSERVARAAGLADPDDEEEEDDRTATVDPRVIEAALTSLAREKQQALVELPTTPLPVPRLELEGEPLVEVPTTSQPRPAVVQQPASAPEDEGPSEEPTASQRTPVTRAERPLSRRTPLPQSDDTRPRAQAPAEWVEPRTEVPLDGVDTNPRATAPVPEETRPRIEVRQTTAHERLRARGQERIETPPHGAPLYAPTLPATGDAEDELDAASSHEDLDEVTNVRPHPRQRPEQTARTSHSLPPTPAHRPAQGRGLRLVIALLATVVLGIAAALVVKMLRPPPAPPLDPGSEEEVLDEPLDAGAAVTALEALDAGVAPAVEDDAGVPEADDAGDEAEEDAGTLAEAPPDAGVSALDAGSQKPPVKKRPPKKKRRRR